MTPDSFAQAVKTALGAHLRSVILYGSAAAGDHAGNSSDYNVLIVADGFDMDALDSLSKPVKTWTALGNPVPRMFTEKQLRDSCDVFPIEMFDMQQSHKVLAGADILVGIEISRANLRHQVEFELRGKLLALRSGGVVCGCDRIALGHMMVAASSPVLSVLRAALRLYDKTIPADKLAALDALAGHVKFDVTPFKKIAAAKGGSASIGGKEAYALFADYLAQIEAVTDAVDAL
jgi:hypothetical protein